MPQVPNRTGMGQKNPNKPFCSERRKNHDLAAWANEENKFSGSSEWGEVLSGEIEAEAARQEDKLF